MKTRPRKKPVPQDVRAVTPADLISTPIFQGLDQADPPLLDKICKASHFFECGDGYQLIHAGDTASVLMLIRSGHVDVCRDDNEENNTIATLGKGSVIGEINLLNQLPHTTHVYAVGRMVGIEIDPHLVEAALPSSPLLCLNLARLLANKIAGNDRRAAQHEKVNYRRKQMVAQAIDHLIETHGFEADQQTINRPITRAQLADSARCSRQTATDAVTELTKEPWQALAPETRYRRIRVLSRPRLLDYANLIELPKTPFSE